ncbi:MAG: hypothetical protein LBN18_08315 [Dysgonamonadaceae bacterium]|jgi:gas vesicle protein|nr:hypothetical protein [Dysgonamonadaceae bacterium]
MKHSKLFIGLGLGALVGAAAALYFASSDEDKQEMADELNATVKKAKKAIGKAVDDSMEQLEKATEKVTKVAQETISKVKEHPVF